MPDPKLQTAMDEIRAVLKKHDIGAYVLLASETHMEYLREFSPSWSCVRIEEISPDSWGIRIKALRSEFESLEAQKTCLNNSVGMLFGFADTLKEEIGHLHEVMAMVGKHMDVQHMTKDVTEEPPRDPGTQGTSR